MRRAIVLIGLYSLGFTVIFLSRTTGSKEFSSSGSASELLCCYSGVVKDGESLYLLFNRLGFPQKVWATISRELKGKLEFNRIKPGEEFVLKVSKDWDIVYFEHKRSEWESIKLTKDLNGGFEAKKDTVVFTKILRCYRGRIETTLWDAMVSDSVPMGLIDNMIRVFAYNIDFATEPRVGDEFAILYVEERYNGRLVRGGDIIMAEYKGKFGTYRAYKFEFPGSKYSYYDENGRSLRRSLLRTPVSFTRISSRFSRSRLHPILGIRRPHLGVDYAAPSGTPVIAAGTGVVTFAGWNEGYGNFVSIDHGGGLVTTYGHLSRFAYGIRKGIRVKEGQVIGYVGATGLATGPHLDYRILRNGKFVDPLRLTAVPGAPIPQSLLESFRKTQKKYLNLLESLAKKDEKIENFD